MTHSTLLAFSHQEAAPLSSNWVAEEINANYLGVAFYWKGGKKFPAGIMLNHLDFLIPWQLLKTLLFYRGKATDLGDDAMAQMSNQSTTKICDSARSWNCPIQYTLGVWLISCTTW